MFEAHHRCRAFFTSNEDLLRAKSDISTKGIDFGTTSVHLRGMAMFNFIFLEIGADWSVLLQHAAPSNDTIFFSASWSALEAA
jgi:hypothetical protein